MCVGVTCLIVLLPPQWPKRECITHWHVLNHAAFFLSLPRSLTPSGHRKMNPFCIPFAINNMGGAMLAMDVGFMGPNYSISTACATGNYCIHTCVWLFLLGQELLWSCFSCLLKHLLCTERSDLHDYPVQPHAAAHAHFLPTTCVELQGSRAREIRRC